jgi:hypothetical protein
MAQQLNQAKTKTENTSAGEQHVIPGVEKIWDAEVARRKAAEPLKPKVGQKPAEIRSRPSPGGQNPQIIWLRLFEIPAGSGRTSSR